MSYNIEQNIDKLFNILKRDTNSIIRNFGDIELLLTSIFTDKYLVEDAADELLQKFSELVNKHTKKDDELFKIALNILFYEELSKYVTGIKFSPVNYYVNSVFAAICYQLHLSYTETEEFLQQAQENAYALMRKINEIRIIETLKVVCNEHQQKLANLKTDSQDINVRINMLMDMQRILDSEPDEQNDVTNCPISRLQNKITAFKEQFKQYQKLAVGSNDSRIHQADNDFISRIKWIFSTLCKNVMRFFRGTSNIYEDFTTKVEKSMALTA